MSRKEPRYGWMWFAIAVAILLWVATQGIAFADDECRGHSCNDGGDIDIDVGGTDVNVGGSTINGGDMIGGDTNVSTGGNKTFAFSHSLGDVDINEGQNCLGSEAWGSFIVSRQTNELNPWCAALFYELNGRHEFAAKMRCDIKEIRKKYSTDSDCWLDQDLTPVAEEPKESELNEAAAQVETIIQLAETRHDEDVAEVQQQVAQIQQQLNDYQNRPAPKPQIVQAPPKREDLLTEQEKLAILGLLTYEDGKDE